MNLINSDGNPSINFIVPLYNEAENFDQLIQRIDSVIKLSDEDIEVILVDDGSKDITPVLMNELSSHDGKYHSVFLSRNFGHQIAISAGMEFVNASKAVMIMDGDLQDPPELFSEFMEKFNEGYDVVYAIRSQRKSNLALNMSYFLFYRIMKRFSYINIPKEILIITMQNHHHQHEGYM